MRAGAKRRRREAPTGEAPAARSAGGAMRRERCVEYDADT
jgi:hypothetical protein